MKDLRRASRPDRETAAYGAQASVPMPRLKLGSPPNSVKYPSFGNDGIEGVTGRNSSKKLQVPGLIATAISSGGKLFDAPSPKIEACRAKTPNSGDERQLGHARHVAYVLMREAAICGGYLRRLTAEDHPHMDDYLTETEAAERYHLGRRTLQRWRTTGEGPRWVRLGPRRVLYRLHDIEAWAAARTYVHRADELARKLADAP